MLRTAKVDGVTLSTHLASSNITLLNMRRLLAEIRKRFSEIRQDLLCL